MKKEQSAEEFTTRAMPVKGLVQGKYVDEFQKKMDSRLEMGKKKYSDKSFLTDNLFVDIKEELLDVANYAYLLYERIRRLEDGEKITDYLFPCRAVDITDTDDQEKDMLRVVFCMWKVCHRVNGREFHYCKKEENE